VLAVALTAVLALVVAGPAAARGPAKVHPQLAVTAAGVHRGTLRFTVTVSFAPPAGTGAATACKGRLKLSEVVKSGKPRRWTGKLGDVAGACAAAIKGRLPTRLFERRVAFRLTFAGNGKIAPFSASRKLKLSAPEAAPPSEAGSPGGGGPGSGSPAGGSPGGGSPGPGSPTPEPPTPPVVPYTAADGYWQGGGLWDTGSGANVAFGVKEAVIYDINLFSSILFRCEKKDSIPEVTHRYAFFPVAPEIPLGPAGAFFDEFTYKAEDANGAAEIPWVVHGQLGASSGTMAIEAHDASFDEHFSGEPEHTLSECHVSATLTVGKH
jgi:hypothetical protein